LQKAAISLRGMGSWTVAMFLLYVILLLAGLPLRFIGGITLNFLTYFYYRCNILT
jgi:hypothetical protein